jgi:hypothetical protein
MIYLALGLVIGAGGSYFVLNNQMQVMENYYENQIEEVHNALSLTTSQSEFEISNLENVVDEIQDSISSLQALNDEYSDYIDDLEDEVDSLNEEVFSLESDVENLEFEMSSLEDRNWDQNMDIQYLEDELDNIMDLEVTQHYEWEYGWSDWSWDLPIPLELYWEYHERIRPDDWAGWAAMCKDSRDDYYIQRLVDGIESTASIEGYSEYETVEYCEDTSILTATLLYEMGYDVALLILEDDNHCAVGIKGGEGVTGTYYPFDGTKYFFIETTGDGWGIGDFPDFDSGTAHIYPLNDY